MSIISISKQQSQKYEVDPQTQSVTNTYRIVLKKDEEGRFVVTCPDLQGVVTDGKDEDEAVTNAYDAVSAMLEALGRTEEFNLIVV
jgi:predicted RNase H-like HicB family nuclease